MSAKILVIDDEESIRYTFQRFLEAEGYTVLTAATCLSARTRLKEPGIDVVFADIILEDGTGIDILGEIKAQELTCPVIMITGDPGLETATASLRLGAFDYIPKPVKQNSLLHATRTALKYKALNEEKEKFRTNLDAIFRSVRDAIVTVDKESRVIALNEAAISLFGYSPDDIGKPFGALTDVCNGRCEGIMNESLETGSAVEVNRIEHIDHKQGTRLISIRTSPLINLQGMLSGIVMVLRDDTHVVNLENELKDHRQFHRIIGKSKAMQKVYALIKTLADIQTTVLITGENGTGKELVAEALHLSGERGSKPLVKVNCSALSESLLESELFGHVKGAFTGAIRDNVGRFQKADGGTLFLDEIGDISPNIQLKLLRVIEEKEFERVGSSTTTQVDVRLVAATNSNLKQKVLSGEFREDLYYRLNVVDIHLPPLRDRYEDIPLLVNHFLTGFNLKFKKSIEAISSDVMKAFQAYHWPGNIRELEHAMEHAFVLCDRNIITCDHLPPDIMASPEKDRQAPLVTQEEEARIILETLDKTDWNKSKAARLLGIDRVTLYRKIERFSITKEKVQAIDFQGHIRSY